MNSHISTVWDEMWGFVWKDLAAKSNFPELFSELCEVLLMCQRPLKEEEVLSMILTDSIARRRILGDAIIKAGLSLDQVPQEDLIDARSKCMSGKTKLQIFKSVNDVLNDRKLARTSVAIVLRDILNDKLLIAEVKDRHMQVIQNDPMVGKKFFKNWKAHQFDGEPGLVLFLQKSHTKLEEIGGDALANQYYVLLEKFLARFGLPYELRRPSILYPTISGLFARLSVEIKHLAYSDQHTLRLYSEYEEAVRDLQRGRTESRIKVCIQKQMNLLEGLGQRCAGVSTNTLGAICGQITTWPHAKVREGMTNLYHFSCNYPGIRHGGTQGSDLRPIDARDIFGVLMALSGFSAYFTDNLDLEKLYHGGP